MKTRLLPVFLFNIILFFVPTAFAQNGPAERPVAYEITAESYTPKKELTRQRRIFAPRQETTILPVSNKSFAARDLEKQVFQLLNTERESNNLALLEWNDDVAKIARLHSENMAKYKFFSHTGLDGLMVNERADLLGIRRWRAIGENIAFSRGYDKPGEFAVEGWLNSAKHRNNILSSRWKESAVGVAAAPDGSVYFTQVFLLRK